MNEYTVFGIFIVLLVAVILAKGVYDDRKEKREFRYKLYHHYGRPPKKEYGAERYASIPRFFEKHPREGQIDDITWNDLSLDDIFKRLNDTYSSAGEEYLYYSLRTPSFQEDELRHFDEVCTYFQEHADERVKTQLILAQLGRTGKFSLYDYLEHLDVLGQRSNFRHYAVNLLFLPAIATIFFQPSYGLVSFAVLAIYNMVTYFKEKNEIDTYITSFAYVMRLLRAADQLGNLKIEACAGETEAIRAHRRKLGRFRRGAFWLMSSGRMSGSGNPIDIFMDYLRMTLHLDLIKFNNMLVQVRGHLDDIDAIVQNVGYIETAIAVGAYRKSAEGQWCRPVFTEKRQMNAENMYHPMINEPVKNSLRTERGVLLTGSNASGKSTFLKTAAICAILSQTICTCPADSYEGSFFRICSSMALRDDLGSGESYYIVEIKSIKRILDITEHSPEKVLCFVDEVLRGTNTVERIAASTQILQGLATEKVLCFAATHDIELTELLADSYENYHFEEEVADGDIRFNYRLLDGKAVTRNAIKLLGIMGYDEKIIERANRQAAVFMETGVWKKQGEV